jgi:hypothetical protein
MHESIPLNTATASKRRIYFYMTLTDGISAATGKAGTVNLRWNGGGEATSSNSITEIDAVDHPGWYYLELTQAESNIALGSITGRLQPAGCANTPIYAVVITDDIYAGADSAATVAAATWNALKAAHVAAGSFGLALGEVDTESAAIAAAVIAIQADTDNLQTRVPAALVGGRMDANVGTVTAGAIAAAAFAAGAITNTVLAADAVNATVLANAAIDKVFQRDISALAGASAKSLFAWMLSGGLPLERFSYAAGVITVYENDGTTPRFTINVTGVPVVTDLNRV